MIVQFVSISIVPFLLFFRLGKRLIAGDGFDCRFFVVFIPFLVLIALIDVVEFVVGAGGGHRRASVHFQIVRH